jgi:hypothetical protein
LTEGMACQTRFSPFWLSTALDQTFLSITIGVL